MGTGRMAHPWPGPCGLTSGMHLVPDLREAREVCAPESDRVDYMLVIPSGRVYLHLAFNFSPDTWERLGSQPQSVGGLNKFMFRKESTEERVMQWCPFPLLSLSCFSQPEGMVMVCPWVTHPLAGNTKWA